jgi:hypothetical protein
LNGDSDFWRRRFRSQQCAIAVADQLTAPIVNEQFLPPINVNKYIINAELLKRLVADLSLATDSSKIIQS